MRRDGRASENNLRKLVGIDGKHELHIPALMTAHMATGYQMVFVLNRETVSAGLRPYLRTSAVLSRVALVLTSSQLRRSFVTAFTYPASWRVDGEVLYSGECGPASNAHCQVVMSEGTVDGKGALAFGYACEEQSLIGSEAQCMRLDETYCPDPRAAI